MNDSRQNKTFLPPSYKTAFQVEQGQPWMDTHEFLESLQHASSLSTLCLSTNQGHTSLGQNFGETHSWFYPRKIF